MVRRRVADVLGGARGRVTDVDARRSAGAGSNDSDAEDNNAGTNSKLRMGETMVLAGKNHATSSPVEDPDRRRRTTTRRRRRIRRRRREGAKNRARRSREGARGTPRAGGGGGQGATPAARALARDARTLTRFFPAFTVAGRQPYAMFTRPNGDIVRASPTLRPAAVADANVAGARVSGKIMRELEMPAARNRGRRGTCSRRWSGRRRSARTTAATFVGRRFGDDGGRGRPRDVHHRG